MAAIQSTTCRRSVNRSLDPANGIAYLAGLVIYHVQSIVGSVLQTSFPFSMPLDSLLVYRSQRVALQRWHEISLFAKITILG